MSAASLATLRQLLGAIADNFDKVVAISGTHGKTTTTAMLMTALKGYAPTCHVGGTVNGVAGCFGGKELFVTEACEYRESFLSLRPHYAIILNVELDHADYYKSYSSFYRAFEKFASNSEVAFVCGDNEAKSLRGRMGTVTFGLEPTNDYYAKIISYSSGYYTFDAYCNGKWLARIPLRIRGEHNVINAMGAIAFCHHAGYDFGGVSEFCGVDRRFETLGFFGSTEYISDYAHHPHEIECTLTAAKKIYSKVLAVFEPHTYTRTKAFCKEFAKALSIADGCVLLPVYAAREERIAGGDSQAIGDIGGFLTVDSYETGGKAISSMERDYDCVIFLGAGTVDAFARRYVADKP